MAGLLPTNGLQVTSCSYWYLSASSPYTRTISTHELILISELYYGYYLVMYVQKQGNVLNILVQDGNNKIRPTMNGNVLSVNSAGGNFELNVSILKFA